MSKKSDKEVIKVLKLENDRILKDLNECQKRIDFLQKFIINYRKILVQFSHKCICNESNDIINSIKSIEFRYKDLFFNDKTEDKRRTAAFDANKSDDNVSEESEDRDDDYEEEEEVIESDGNQSEELMDESNDGSVDEVIQLSDQQINENNDEINDNSVLVFNEQNNTINEKTYDNINTNEEFIINSFVNRNSEDLLDETIEEVVNRCKEQNSCQTNDSVVEEFNQKSVNNTKKSNKSRAKPPSKTTITQSVYLDSTTGQPTILLPIPSLNDGSVEHYIERVDPKNIMTQRQIPNDFDVRNQSTDETDLQILSKINGKVQTLVSDPIWSSSSLKSSKKYFDIFNALIEELKSGRIESFIDPKHKLITVFIRNEESSEGKSISDIVFKCNYNDCQYESNCKKYVRSHVLRHQKNNIYICQMCREEYNSKIAYIEHRIGVHNIDENRLFKCNFNECQYKTTIRQSFELHSITHKTERTVSCDVDGCHMTFKSEYSMKVHRKAVHKSKEFACDWPGCEANFKTKIGLKTHLMSHMGQNKTVGRLRELMKRGDYVSTVDKNNDLISVIRQQIVSQSDGMVGIGPKLGYKCNYTECRFVCILPHLMSQHITTHSMGKTFECGFCRKRFALKKYWTQHQRNVHNINNSSPLLSCKYPDCDYKTRNAFSLRSHSSRHRTDTPFKCEENDCNKRFKTKICLKQHTVFCHTKVKPFVCEFIGCESAFKVKTNLSRHLKSHEKKEPNHRCDRCSKTFKSKSNFIKHNKTKH